jgi:hypothetical protein
MFAHGDIILRRSDARSAITLPNNRTELIEAVRSYRQFYDYERLHMSLGSAHHSDLSGEKSCSETVEQDNLINYGG